MGPEGKMSWGSKVSAPIFFHPDQKTGQVFKTETLERSEKNLWQLQRIFQNRQRWFVFAESEECLSKTSALKCKLYFSARIAENELNVTVQNGTSCFAEFSTL